MYRIKYDKIDKLYSVFKYIGSQCQHCVSSYDLQRCVEYINQVDKITYTYTSFTM